jgi:glycosyltransferase involved in cell wall biosynthesis
LGKIITLVSIIIPVYNRAERINPTIQSVLSQSYSNFECILVDDYSTDNLFEVFKSWNLDSRFRLIKNNRAKGAQGARNTGILNSNGDYICLFDSDNFMERNFLEEHVHNLSENEGEYISVCHSQFYNPNLERITQDALNFSSDWVLPDGDIFLSLLKGKTYVDYNNLLFPKSIINKIGYLDEQIISFQELDFAIRAAKKFHFSLIDKVLVKYIVGSEDSISSNFKSSRGRVQILLKYKQSYLENGLKKEYHIQLEFAIKALLHNNNFGYFFALFFKKQLVRRVFFKILRNRIIESNNNRH